VLDWSLGGGNGNFWPVGTKKKKKKKKNKLVFFGRRAGKRFLGRGVHAGGKFQLAGGFQRGPGWDESGVAYFSGKGPGRKSHWRF